jgi:hypothetical protein
VTNEYLETLTNATERAPGLSWNWAENAGLLRVSGVAYQFRHRQLQDYVFRQPRIVSDPRKGLSADVGIDYGDRGQATSGPAITTANCESQSQ